MKIHYEKTADHLTITFRENGCYGKDAVLEDGKVCLTFNPEGELSEMEIGEASKNGELVLSYCNLPIGEETTEELKTNHAA